MNAPHANISVWASWSTPHSSTRPQTEIIPFFFLLFLNCELGAEYYLSVKLPFIPPSLRRLLHHAVAFNVSDEGFAYETGFGVNRNWTASLQPLHFSSIAAPQRQHLKTTIMSSSVSFSCPYQCHLQSVSGPWVRSSFWALLPWIKGLYLPAIAQARCVYIQSAPQLTNPSLVFTAGCCFFFFTTIILNFHCFPFYFHHLSRLLFFLFFFPC